MRHCRTVAGTQGRPGGSRGPSAGLLARSGPGDRRTAADSRLPRRPSFIQGDRTVDCHGTVTAGPPGRAAASLRRTGLSAAAS